MIRFNLLELLNPKPKKIIQLKHLGILLIKKKNTQSVLLVVRKMTYS